MQASDELDLTNGHLKSLDEVEILTALTLVDLTANRFTTIDPRLVALTGLRSLNLRQNLLTDASAWSGACCKGALEDLELRDNQLEEIPDLKGFLKLRRLDVSYNQIRGLERVEALAGAPLKELFVAANKVTAIVALSALTELRVLELGSNRIRTIQGLGTLTGLQELWLGRNRIQLIENLGTLRLLRKLSIQSNRLESMLGLEECTALEELYLSHNGIWRMEGLSTLSRLQVLDLSNNRISKVEGLEAQTQLEDLWLNNNQLPSLDGLDVALKPCLGTLSTVYLEKNPAASNPQYKPHLVSLLPHLKQLDADFV